GGRGARGGERWGVGGFLAQEFRVVVALLGYPLMLAVGPWIVGATPKSLQWPIAVLLCGAFLAWNHFFNAVLLAVLRAKPIERPDLDSQCAEIDKKSRVPTPRVYCTRPTGGTWFAKLGLSDFHKPSILLSHSIVERFDAAELCGLYAHELAMVEGWNRRRLTLYYALFSGLS